jgi:predicted dehydrogenase
MLERPNGKGQTIPCDTWDNATLVCEAGAANSTRVFPLTLRIQRISPGEKNNWYLHVLGTKACARFSTKDTNTLEILEYTGGEQAWRRIDMGHEVAYKSITPQAHQFGMSDAILQMLGAFLCELDGGEPPALFAGCVTGEETALSHRLFTAALESHSNGTVVAL